MKTTIRKYNSSDRNNCIAAFQSNVPLFFADYELQEFENFLTKIEQQEISTHFFVIIAHENVVGCGGFGDKNNTGNFSMAWGLIHNDFHKKGLGKKLLLYRVEQLKLLKLENPILLDTTQHSYGFFEKFGFETIKITNDYYKSGLHRYDMILKTTSNSN
jgi:N-acetylglutamate synthase-like GNAT family acetyltransferase